MSRVSYTQLSMWRQCPWRWKLNYIDGHSVFTESIYTLFGTSMHETVHTYLTVFYNDTIKAADSLQLDKMLQYRMMENFKKAKEEIGEDCCTKEEMSEFYLQGVIILDWLKKNKANYFSKRGYELIGIEVPLNYELSNNIKFVGYIDIVIKDTIRDVIKIYDIKTSTVGWNKYMKVNKNKTNQILLYKQFYSKQFNHPIDKIEVEYFILKRKLYENVDFPQKRIQKFSPASGTPSLNKVNMKLKDFIDECFTNDGEYNLTTIYSKEASKKNCQWCDFKDKPELCDASYYRRK